MRSLLAAVLLLAPASLAWAQSNATRADSAWAAGDRKLARRLYSEEIAANPDNSRAVFRLAKLSRNSAEALRLYQRYTALEPDDAWGWMAVGDQLTRLGRIREAFAAYDRAVKLRPDDPDILSGRARVQRASRARAPALEPVATYTRDSDGNRTSRIGVRVDWQAGPSGRLGVMGFVSRIGNGAVSHPLQEGWVRVALGTGRAAQFSLNAGAARLQRGPALPAWITPVAESRLRLRAPRQGPALELRADRRPLAATPLLVENQALRSEARVTAELPLGPLRLRAGGRAASIKALDQTNTRWMADGALVVPLGWQGEFSLQYHRIHYARPTTLGYFAADRVETLEAGSYAELERKGVSLAFDLGVGAQRLQEFGTGLGPWRLALRGWSYVAIAVAPGGELRLELEGYDAPFAPEGVSSSLHWRSLSLSAGVRWAFR
jgi:hypothetical protein